MSEPLYQLEGISHSYGDRQVLQIDSLNVCRGEALALVGPSGAGKSTLLRLLNFLETPTHGRIQFLNQASQPMPLHLRRRVTTVFQRPFLLNRSVSANVRYGLGLRGQRDHTHAMEKALEQVGLLEMARQPARTLSGGEAQRVALARAIVIQPDVLLLDEPTANLDPQNVALIENIIMQLNKEQGTTLVLVTHNIFQARRLAQRAALLMDGRLIETATAGQFFNKPTQPQTAAFIRGDIVY